MAKSNEIKRFLFLLTISAIVTYILYWLPFNYDAELLSNPHSIRNCFISIIWLTFFFALTLKFNLFIRSLLVITLLSPSAISTYIGIVYKIQFSVTFIADIVESGIGYNETSNFFTIDVLYTIFITLLAFVFIAFITGIKLSANSFYKSKLSLKICLAFTILPICFTHILDSIYPTKKIYLPISYYNKYKKQHKPFLEKIYAQEQKKGVYKQIAKPSNDLHVFLHVGESVRADHLPINGYTRSTTPFLTNEMQNGNVINFGPAISYSVSTRQSIVGILTSTRINETDIKPTFYNALNYFNIPTNVFYSSMVNHINYQDVSLVAVQKQCKNKVFSQYPSFSLLPEILKTHNQNDVNNGIFSMYYGEGSHLPYTSYDHAKYEIFKPISNSFSKDERCINNYDNTIISTDAFMKEVFDILRDKNAVYIFTSDHGDGLGDEETWGRGDNAMNIKCCRYVPFIIWVSEKFKKENIEKYNTLVNNSHRLKRISHDHIYHTIIGAYNIETEEYDSNLDLFSPKAIDTDYIISKPN